MKHYQKQGFTLLELLVAVVILGILTSVALPMYQKTVYRARLSQLDVILDASKKNMEMAIMAGSSETIWFTGTESMAETKMPGDCSSDMLDCSVPFGSYQSYMEPWGPYAMVAALISNLWSPMSYVMFTYNNQTKEFLVAEINNPHRVLCEWLEVRNFVVAYSVQEECEGMGITFKKVLPFEPIVN